MVETVAAKKNGGGEPPIGDLRKRRDQAKKLFAQIRALFPEAREMPSDDRRRSQGKVGAEEAEALGGVVDAMEAAPGVFQSLADRDGGNDPKKLETDLMRERLERQIIYQDVVTEGESVLRVLADEALAEGARVVPVLRAGYEIAKPVSKSDPVIRGKIAKLLDYHGANAQASIASRRANKANKANKANNG